jgi:hypothetical protein
MVLVIGSVLKSLNGNYVINYELNIISKKRVLKGWKRRGYRAVGDDTSSHPYRNVQLDASAMLIELVAPALPKVNAL